MRRLLRSVSHFLLDNYNLAMIALAVAAAVAVSFKIMKDIVS